MSMLLLLSLVTVIAALAVVGLCLLVIALYRSAQLMPATAPGLEQRRRPRLRRRGTSALL
jgi:hypothetical protein